MSIARSVACSLSSTFEMVLLIVFGLHPNRSATSAFE